MKNRSVVFLGIVLIILVASVVFILIGSKAKSNQVATTNSTSNAQKNLKKTNVLLTKTGFDPKSITVKANTRVVWSNTSGENATVNSDPYPTNTLWKFLNLGLFKDGENVSVSFEKAGKYTYHNQFKPEQTGTIIVE